LTGACVRVAAHAGELGRVTVVDERELADEMAQRLTGDETELPKVEGSILSTGAEPPPLRYGRLHTHVKPLLTPKE
jgi:hypothetical protein